MEKIYTKEEVASILSVKELTITRWVRSGKLPHIRLNGSNAIRITESQLQDWMDRTKETSPRDSSTYKRKKQPKSKNSESAYPLMLELTMT